MFRIQLILVLILVPGLSFCQSDDVWQIVGSLSHKFVMNGSYDMGGNSHTYNRVAESNGSIFMTVRCTNLGNDVVQILLSQEDSIIQKVISGSAMESIFEYQIDRKTGIGFKRLDDREGTVENGGITMEYNSELDGTKGFEAAINFKAKRKYTEENFGDYGGTTRISEVDTLLPGFLLQGPHEKYLKITKVKNGFLIDGVSNMDTSYEQGLDNVHETTKEECHFFVLKKTMFEAVIKPVLATYKEWLPLGPDPKNPEDLGNAIDFTVYVLNKSKPGQKFTSSIKKVTYFLDNPSHEPGYAMNYPIDNPSKIADLQLSNKFTKADASIEQLEVTVPLSKDLELIGRVHSLDYGSYGKIRALVELTTGEILLAKSEESDSPYCLIPYRKSEDSQVADYWKDSNNVSALSDTDDNETQANLGDGHAGDGLTLYEEYRGFIENQKHVRTDPKKLDLMVCDLIEDRAKDGINMFKYVTGINVHDNFQEYEFGKVDTDQPAGYISDNCINCNSSSKTHAVDQHGIAIVKKDVSQGYAQAVLKDAEGKMGTPKRYRYVEITQDFDPGPNGYSVIKGTIDKNGNTITDPNGKAKIITDEYAVTVAHEMLHCCNVYHHGEVDRIAVLTSGEDLAGKTPGQIYISVDGLPFYEANVYWDDENRTPLTTSDVKKGQKLSIGVEGGQHSGVEDCIMRYDNAVGYFKGSDLYLIRKGKNEIAESTGIQLCSSSKGTGVNAPDHKPRPRYGDATKGDCRHQFCINDKYH